MRKQTDLAKVKQTALALLSTEINETPYSPMIVKHPFTDTGVCVLFGCKDKNADSGDGYILPETEILTNRHSGGMQDEYKFTYEYDSYGNIVKEEQYEKGKFRDIRECCTYRTYTYDENGKIAKEIIREEYFRTSITNGHFVSEGGYNYFYNENGQLITKDIIYISAAEDDLCGYKYEYDEYGNCIKESEYFPTVWKSLFLNINMIQTTSWLVNLVFHL